MTSRIITSRQLFGKAYQVSVKNWRILAKVTAVYGVLDLFFVHGLSATVNLANVQAGSNQLTRGANVVSGLLGASGSGASQAASYYQSVLLVLVSLATIYVLNCLYAKKSKP